MLNADEITATSETLMRQAPMTVMEYVRALREAMGPEWAAANPAAFATLVQAAAADFQATLIARELGRVARAIDALADRGND